MTNSSNAESTTGIADCKIHQLTVGQCESLLTWLLGGPRTEIDHQLNWALAHCDDGVTWGRYDQESKRWLLGSDVCKEVSPTVRAERLQELRMFGSSVEVFIWQDEGELNGRVIEDVNKLPRSNPLRSSDESRILRGDTVRQTLEHEFTLVADHAGAEQVIPLAATQQQLQAHSIRLVTRHYYERDKENGAIRVAASRLVELNSEGTK